MRLVKGQPSGGRIGSLDRRRAVTARPEHHVRVALGWLRRAKLMGQASTGDRRRGKAVGVLRRAHGLVGEPRRYDAKKRCAYLLVLGSGTALVAALAVVEGLAVSYWGLAYPALVVYGGVLWLLVWRRRLSARATEAASLIALVAVLLGDLAVWRVAPTLVSPEAIDLVLVMLWAGIAFPLCFLLFGTRSGLRASVAVYVVFVLLVVPPAIGGQVPEGAADVPAIVVFSLTVFFGVLIALLWVLASRMEELAASRTEARLLAAQALRDPLTGLPNRRALDDELDRQLARADRHGHPLSVALIDLDHFKSVNDRLGHHAGDRALVAAGRRLAAAVRQEDYVGRWGGEEFLLIAAHTGHDQAVELAERCRHQIADRASSGVGAMTASFGVATRSRGDGARSLVKRADRALYEAKRQGRDCVVGIHADKGWQPEPIASGHVNQGGASSPN